MKAKLFDTHNKLLEEKEIKVAESLLQVGNKKYRLTDTDDAGTLAYREVDDQIGRAVEKSGGGGKAR